MRVIVDAFGGDNAPLEILKGCAMAVQEYGVDIIACGSERVIRDVCEKNKISLDRISIADVEKVIPVARTRQGHPPSAPRKAAQV